MSREKSLPILCLAILAAVLIALNAYYQSSFQKGRKHIHLQRKT